MSDGLKFVSACIAETAGSILARIDRETLIDGPERTVFEYALSYYREYRRMPQPETVRSDTGIRLPPAREGAAYYERALYNRRANSEAKQYYTALRAALEGTRTEDIRAAAEAAYMILQACRRSQPVDHVLGAAAVGELVVRRLREAILSPADLSGITTGWPELDVITDGYQPSDLITWVARPGLGKTWMLYFQALAGLLSGRRVLVATTELSAEQTGRRFAALDMGIRPELLKSAHLDTRLVDRIMDRFHELQRSGNFHVASLGFNSQVARLDAICEELAPDAAYVDGVYLLKPSTKGVFSKTEKVGMVFDELKTLAMARNIPVVATTQFNRQAGKGGREGSLETIGMSDVIGQNSSIVISLKEGPTLNPRDSREIELMKGREGETGTLVLNYRFAPLNFNVMSEEERLAQDNEGLGI